MIIQTSELVNRIASVVRANRRTRAIQVLSLLAGVILFFSLSLHLAQAAPINYGSFMGNTVTYVDVTENSATDPQYFPPVVFPPNPAAGLSGKPVVGGDSLDFMPINFFAISDFRAPPFDHT